MNNWTISLYQSILVYVAIMSLLMENWIKSYHIMNEWDVNRKVVEKKNSNGEGQCNLEVLKCVRIEITQWFCSGFSAGHVFFF